MTRFLSILFFSLQVGTDLRAVRAGEITLTWNYSADQAQVGTYLVYWRESSDYIFTNRFDAGLTNQATISNLTDGINYAFVVVAVGTNGQPSPFSNEVTYGDFGSFPPPFILEPYIQIYWPQTIQESTDSLHWNTFTVTNGCSLPATNAQSFFRLSGVTNAQIRLSPAP